MAENENEEKEEEAQENDGSREEELASREQDISSREENITREKEKVRQMRAELDATRTAYENEIETLENRVAELEEELGNVKSSPEPKEGSTPHDPISTAPPLDEDEYERVANQIRQFARKGQPENSNRLRAYYNAGKKPPNSLMSDGVVKTSKNVEVNEDDIPPRKGKGSSQKDWAEFAVKVSDMDESVLERMGRNDIINYLEVEGIIPEAGEDNDDE